MTERTMDDKSIDELFDEGVDMTQFIVEDSITFPGLDSTPRKINISMPEWLISDLDREARYLAVPRQAVINMWLAERLEQERAKWDDVDRARRSIWRNAEKSPEAESVEEPKKKSA